MTSLCHFDELKNYHYHRIFAKDFKNYPTGENVNFQSVLAWVVDFGGNSFWGKSPRRLRAKYSLCTNLRFIQRVSSSGGPPGARNSERREIHAKTFLHQDDKADRREGACGLY